MYHCTKISIADLNPHLMCVLCGGYFIDATTIIECLHSFCRTCVVRYLESSKFCPICDVQVHKTRPLLNIRSDKTLQDLVYKLVPGLFEKEMLRRREFLSQHPEIPTLGMDLEQRGMAHMVPAHSLPEERISLVLQLVAPAPSLFSDPRTHSITSLKPRDRRYLLCPSDVTIGHLKKFVRIKFGLQEKYQIDVFYKQSEETINDDFTLLDVTFIYSWNRKKPLRLCYSVYEKPRRKRKLTAAARSLVSRPSPARKARLEDRKMTHTSDLDHLSKTSVSSSLSSGRAMMSTAVKNKLNVQQSSSRTAKLPGRGAFCSKGTNTKLVKMKKDAWKKRSSFGGKIPGKINASFHGVQKNGAGRKKMVPTTKSVTAGSFSTKLTYRKDSSNGKLKEKNGNTKSDTKHFNGKPDSVFSNGSMATVSKAKNITTHSSSPTKKHVSKVNGSVSPTLSASFHRKSASASATAASSGRIGANDSDGPKTLKVSQLKQSSSRSSSPRLPVTNDSRCSSPKLLGVASKDKNSPSSKLATNGASRSGSPRLSVSNGSRSGSPRLLRELESNGSRSGSPRFFKVSETNGSRSGSPRLSSVGDRGSRSGSPKLLNGKTDSSKTSSGYTTLRTVTAKHSDTHRVRSSPLFPSVPVEERITIDVTTSSETSSDVTSPGAEDRANSTGLEEPEDFDAGGHVCNVAVFAPRPLPSLVHIPHNGLRHSGKSGVKDSAKVSRPSHVDSDSKTHSNKKR
ncbi:polycomb group protein Psc-like [Littorina saxatilis]|uniref:RING-type domain-containing protein n=1 Tax=Littorina saxatilis TaxID=31220 RepID=A0AAN9GIW3_9CAEN